MKILWHSNAPYAPSGYGNQTNLFTRLLKEAGHEVVISTFYGLRGAVLNAGGIPILPASLDQWGNDILSAHYAQYQPDVVVTLMDVWVLGNEVYDAMPIAAWTPIDHNPMPPGVLDALEHIRWPIAMSRFGEKEMRRVGLDPFYVPHGIDTEYFKPKDRTEARAHWNIGEGTFLAAVVAANKGTPSRKSLDRIIKAWGKFARTHPDSLLYLHSLPVPAENGYDLRELARFYGLDNKTVRFVDEYRLIRGDYGPTIMADLYNAADVLLAPSMGEGFGIPAVEAQASGCPVVVSDFSAQPELCFGGYKIPVDPFDDLVYTYQMSEQASIRPGAIVEALEWAYEKRGDATLRQAAFEGARAYDAKRVFETYMLPALAEIADKNRMARRVKALAKEIKLIPTGNPSPNGNCPGEHDWSPTGVYDQGKLCFPCRRGTCEAELREENGYRVEHPHGFTLGGLDIEDDPQGGVAKIVYREIQRDYDLDSIPFANGDVVIDVGAQVGVVSIFLAKKHPGITVYAFEPVPANFARLQRNIQANGVANVTAVNRALTGDGRDFVLWGDPATNSGGISGFIGGAQIEPLAVIPSLTLAEVFEAYAIERCKLLKLDCEGAEYEILNSSEAVLSRVDNLRGEFHMNAALARAGYDYEATLQRLHRHIPPENIKTFLIPMAEAT